MNLIFTRLQLSTQLFVLILCWFKFAFGANAPACHGDAQGKECVTESSLDSYPKLICSLAEGAALTTNTGDVLSRDFRSMSECNGFLKTLATRSVDDLLFLKYLKAKIGFNADNGRPFEKIGFQLQSCLDPSFDSYPVKNVAGFIEPSCAPEVLYSWGPYEKLDWFIHNLGDQKQWPSTLPRSLFTISSAAGSFGYGPFAIRFKIKPNIQFKLIKNPGVSNCAGYVSYGLLKATELNSTIISRYAEIASGRTLLEHTICSSEVIESWSFATDEHLDEIIRDHNWMRFQPREKWVAYTKSLGLSDYLNNDIDSSNAYKTDFSLDRLSTSLSLQRALALSGFGQVFVPLGAAPQTRERHFLVQAPNYFLKPATTASEENPSP